ncbi:hypothetical protein, partial [Leyella stercorea]|uniref:hypothetical protein n=1 Tax=Leyella stercorea TaxID=363265 RepID=UPI0024326416
VGGYGIPAIPTHPVTVMFSHRFHGSTQMVRLRSGLPQNSQNTQKFIAEKELPQRTLRGALVSSAPINNRLLIGC